jgi:hypothetical protein
MFCDAAAAVGAILVLPRTVTLEDERHQGQLFDTTISELASARDLLMQWGVAVPPFDPREIVSNVDIATALRDSGATVETCDPTLDDYRDAERRACLHLAPQPPERQSDEMRDLVIWAIALRLARRDRGAILISRDTVHWGTQGRDEADAAGLYRAKNFDEASEILGRETPAGKLARQMLAAVWSEARAAGLPLPEQVSVDRFTDLQFSADDAGNLSGRLGIVVRTSKGQLSARAHISQASPGKVRAELSEIRVGRNPWGSGTMAVTAGGELPQAGHPVEERLADLRRVLEEE